MAKDFGIGTGIGAVAVVAATAVAALFPQPNARLAIVAVTVAAGAAILDDPRASLATALLGYLLVNGFLVNRLGDLTWDGRTSVGQIAVVGAAVAMGLLWRRVRLARAAAAQARELQQMLDSTPRTKEHTGG